MIEQTGPLPSLESAQSRILLEEFRRAQDSALTNSPFIAHGPPTASPATTAPLQQQLALLGQREGGGSGRDRGGQ